MGVVSDKNLETILTLFPKNASYYFCEPKILRALNVAILKAKASEFGLSGESFKSVNQAYKISKEKASVNDLIYIGGSTFVVAEVL